LEKWLRKRSETTLPSDTQMGIILYKKDTTERFGTTSRFHVANFNKILSKHSSKVISKTKQMQSPDLDPTEILWPTVGRYISLFFNEKKLMI
jgi:hypothetical protein